MASTRDVGNFAAVLPDTGIADSAPHESRLVVSRATAGLVGSLSSVVVLMLGPLWAVSHLVMAALLNFAPDMVDPRHAFAASAGQPR
jgi:hypothetical protein